MEFRQWKQGKQDEKAEEWDGEKRKEGESGPFDVLRCNTDKVNSKGLLKMHDMHTTRKYVMDF